MRYTGSHPSPPAGRSCDDAHRCEPPDTAARSAPIPHPANHLDSADTCAYADGERYQSKASASPIVSTTTVNHNLLVSLNYFSLGFSVEIYAPTGSNPSGNLQLDKKSFKSDKKENLSV